MDGEEALELVLAEAPSLIITDLQMPMMSGLDFCKELRRRETTKNIPVIMLTARGFDIEAQDMIEAGISIVLAKPFSPRELLDKARDLLGETEAASAET